MNVYKYLCFACWFSASRVEPPFTYSTGPYVGLVVSDALNVSMGFRGSCILVCEACFLDIACHSRFYVSGTSAECIRSRFDRPLIMCLEPYCCYCIPLNSLLYSISLSFFQKFRGTFCS